MRAQRGTTTVEFAVVGMLFLLLLIATIELGRLLYAWNTLEESARRAARVAAVCPVNHAGPARVAVFDPGADGGDSPVLAGFTPGNVRVDYLDQNGAQVIDTATHYGDIRYVRVRIQNYLHRLYIPGLPGSITMPDFATVLPRESLGVSPEGVACFGTAS